MVAQRGFVNFSFTVEDIQRTALLWIPAQYNADEKWPLIIFLHSGWGNGDNNGKAFNNAMKGEAIVKAIKNNPERFPAIVAIPRCPSGKIWVPFPPDPIQSAWRSGLHGTRPVPDAMAHIDALIEQVLTKFSIEVDRVALAGHSMGGEGTYRYAAFNINRFAAIALSAGAAVIVPEDAKMLSRIPIWTFQGELDTYSTAELAKKMVAAIRGCGGDIRYTEYKGLGHNIAEQVFGSDEVISWLLAQHRNNRLDTV